MGYGVNRMQRQQAYLFATRATRVRVISSSHMALNSVNHGSYIYRPGSNPKAEQATSRAWSECVA